MSTCQICARTIKDKTGVIAHHGYKREHGWQSASCMGARQPCYEQSRDVIPRVIEIVSKYKASREEYLAAVKAGTATLVSRYAYTDRFIKPGDKGYEQYKPWAISNTESEIKSAQREIERLQARYDAWTPKNSTITEE